MRRVLPLVALEFDQDARELSEIETRLESCKHDRTWTWRNGGEYRTCDTCGSRFL